MAIQPDILIKSPQGHSIAVVEVKNRQHWSRDLATDFRRNMIVHGLLSQVPYFLLASQDVGFLWKNVQDANLDTPPTYEFPMDNVVKRYIEGNLGERLYGAVLDLVVQRWLSDLTLGARKTLEEPEKTLERAGFNESIRGAQVILEENI